ncbi:MAG TPA: hypothetical protein ENI77_09795, partial [Nitrospirae bacterium]|nr:hypothetical protein [Nitrospirota bacterium]
MSKALRLEDLEEFEKIRIVPPQAITDKIKAGIRSLNETEEIEPFIQNIIADYNHTPHNSVEIADILTTKVTYHGEVLFAAFVIKGKSFKIVRPKDIDHQILRLQPMKSLDLIILLASGDILDAVKRDLTSVAESINAYFIIADVVDTARLFLAHYKICSNDGHPFISGKCAQCGLDEDAPSELEFRLKEEPLYTIIEQGDASHGLAKRFSVRAVTDPHYSKSTIRHIAKIIIWEFRQSAYCRSKPVENHFGQKTPDCIMLFLFPKLDETSQNNWICRAVWNREDLKEEYKHKELSEKFERLGNIIIDWNPHYYEIKELVSKNSITKEVFVGHIENILPSIDKLMDIYYGAYNSYTSGDLHQNDFQNIMVKLEKDAYVIYDKSVTIAFPPYECQSASSTFSCYVSLFHNIFIAFAEWSQVGGSWDN